MKKISGSMPKISQFVSLMRKSTDSFFKRNCQILIDIIKNDENKQKLFFSDNLMLGHTIADVIEILGIDSKKNDNEEVLYELVHNFIRSPDFDSEIESLIANVNGEHKNEITSQLKMMVNEKLKGLLTKNDLYEKRTNLLISIYPLMFKNFKPQILSLKEIAEKNGVSYQTAYRILSNARNGEIDGLRRKMTTGRPSQIKKIIFNELTHIVLKSVPTDHGIQSKKWTGESLKKLLSDQFHTNKGAVQCRSYLRLIRGKAVTQNKILSAKQIIENVPVECISKFNEYNGISYDQRYNLLTVTEKFERSSLQFFRTNPMFKQFSLTIYSLYRKTRLKTKSI